MDATVVAGLFGIIGGVARVAVGILKAIAVKRKIYWGYAILTMALAGIIGALLGIVFDFDKRLAVLAGYAGTDILEGIYKSFKVEKVYVKNK